MTTPPTSTLVAGVGNVFLRDDGFGSEVARHLLHRRVPDGVRVVDYGIGGIHLAYDLLDGVDLLVLVDALPRGLEPGTLTLLEADEATAQRAGVDSHAMDPVTVLANVRALGGEAPRTLVVGCEPADVDDGMGLTPDVHAAVGAAADMVLDVIDEHHPGRTVRKRTEVGS